MPILDSRGCRRRSRERRRRSPDFRRRPQEADSGRFGKADSGRFLHSGIREQPTEGRFGGSEFIRGFGDAEGVPTGSTEGCFTHIYDDFSHLLLSLFRTTEPCEELLTDSPKVRLPYVFKQFWPGGPELPLTQPWGARFVDSWIRAQELQTQELNSSGQRSARAKFC